MPRRATLVLLAIAILGATASCSPGAEPPIDRTAPSAVGPAPPATLPRIAGASPYEIAASAVATLFPAGSGVVVVASGDPGSFERGQLGASLAGVIGKPLLFTDTGRLPAETADVIESLGATRAIIVGGADAVGPEVEATLAAMGLETSRCGGGDIHEDAREVARATRDLWRGLYDGKVFLVRDDPVDWRVLYSVAPAAYSGGVPVLFTGREEVPPVTLETMDEIGVTKAVILGSDAHVGDDVVEQLEDRGITTVRVAEAGRDGLGPALAEWSTTDG